MNMSNEDLVCGVASVVEPGEEDDGMTEQDLVATDETETNNLS